MHLVFIPINPIILRQLAGHSFCELFLIHFSFFVAVAVRANVFLFIASEFVGQSSVRTIVNLIEERIEENLDERVRIHAVHFVFTFEPRLLIVDLRAPLRKVEVILGWPSEILHPVRIVTVRPIMLFVENRTKRCLVAVKQKMVDRKLSFELI